MIFATLLYTIIINMTVNFFEFPVNIWVTSFMVYAFHGSLFLQLGMYCKKQ